MNIHDIAISIEMISYYLFLFIVLLEYKVFVRHINR